MSYQHAELVVNDFLLALQAKDHDKIAALLAPDLQYTNAYCTDSDDERRALR